MNKIMSVLRGMTATAAVLCLSAPASAQAYTSGSSNSRQLEGVYNEVNSGLKSDQLKFVYEGGEVFIGKGGLYDFEFGYQGIPQNLKAGDGSVSFDCVLNPTPGTPDENSYSAHISLTKMPSGIYEMELECPNGCNRNLASISGSTSLYKVKGSMIDGTVPAKLGEKVTVAGLLKALAPYVFTPEMMATVMALRDPKTLSDMEVLRHDERNRFLDYAWGSEGRCMECKYWIRNDGKVLLVLNTHDATYEYPQDLRFFLFDRNTGTLTEIPRAVSDKWPLGDEAVEAGICYQVRYYSDGLVALVPQKNGDSFDVVTIKFDGQIFK